MNFGVIKEKFMEFIRELSQSVRGGEPMSLNIKKLVVAGLSVAFVLSLLIVAWIEGGRRRFLSHPDVVIPRSSKDCVACHETKTPGIVGQWKESKHSRSGIGCYDCHKAVKTDKDAFLHEGKTIATIVSPKDCSGCHEREYKQFQASHHSKGGVIAGSLDNVLAEVVEGKMMSFAPGGKPASPVAVTGCLQCHGSEVRVIPNSNGKLDPATWPNTGIGRIDPDGYLTLTDRAKDVIKSGGEWISSIDVENAAVGCPGVAEAAVIGLPHPKWSERPLLIIVRAKGSEVAKEEILAFLDGKIAKWWIPTDVVFVDEIPHTATGKISKLQLREQFADYKLS